ncbi:MAG: hypothetical protein HQK77_12800 [Desulfobacterales bacterium]|nr:hypothetical protein [Desulfobacterales bacterium]
MEITDDIKKKLYYEEIEKLEGGEKIMEIRGDIMRIGYDQGMIQGIEVGMIQGIEVGRNQGIVLGRNQGIELGRNQGIRKLHRKGFSIKEIAEFLDLKEDVVIRVLQKFEET